MPYGKKSSGNLATHIGRFHCQRTRFDQAGVPSFGCLPVRRLAYGHPRWLGSKYRKHRLPDRLSPLPQRVRNRITLLAQLGRRIVIEHQGGIVIHGATLIGDDTIIRQGCTFGIRKLDRLNDAPAVGKM